MGSVTEVEYQRVRSMSDLRVSDRLATSNNVLFWLGWLSVCVPVQRSPPAMKALETPPGDSGGSSRAELQKMSTPVPLGSVMCPASGATVVSQMS